MTGRGDGHGWIRDPLGHEVSVVGPRLVDHVGRREGSCLRVELRPGDLELGNLRGHELFRLRLGIAGSGGGDKTDGEGVVDLRGRKLSKRGAAVRVLEQDRRADDARLVEQ